MLAKVHSAQVVGLKVDLVSVEVDISKGLHSFSIVGLPDKAIQEAEDRISAAIKNSGFRSPQKGNKKVIVSLAPADIKKEGPIFDLAIAIGFLLAAKEIKFEPKKVAFLGELALNGEVRGIKGALMIAEKLAKAGFTELYLPKENAKEAALIKNLKVFGIKNLAELTNHLSPKEEPRERVIVILNPEPPTEVGETEIIVDQLFDMSDVKGQFSAKRGLEIAAAGGHNLAMSGPPGTGKSMLAKAFTSILPNLNFNQMMEATGIHSAAGVLGGALVTRPPLRAPHHTASYISLVGGGAWPKPGEITLAHHGVLFLDEFPEFDRRVIESLRQPLEDRVIQIARARGSMTFPASFILIATMNPCPCGHKGVRGRECVCSAGALMKYERKISGPIIDRIDLWLDVPVVEYEKLSQKGGEGETSVKIKDRVILARERQKARSQKLNVNEKLNSQISAKEIEKLAPLSESCVELLNSSAKQLGLSARAYHRIIKLSRTIADLASASDIKEEHLLEALQYRPKK